MLRLTRIWPQILFPGKDDLANYMLAVGGKPGQVVLPAMVNNYRIELSSLDLGQLLDGLESRAESWERTAKYLRVESMHEGESFLVEECNKPEEADGIAGHYRSIISKIYNQIEEQS